MSERKPEQKAWDRLKSAIESRLKAHRVENLLGNGMSDVVGINRSGAVFWLELKAVASWPAKGSTAPLKSKFEPGQVPFMKEWNCWNGSAFVLLRVGTVEWFLIDPTKIDPRELNRVELVNSAVSIGLENIICYLESLE